MPRVGFPLRLIVDDAGVLCFNMKVVLHVVMKGYRQPTLAGAMRSRSDLGREIIMYLRAHPEAADTLNGILEWWIPDQRNENELQKALEDLVRQGIVEEYVQIDGSRYYRLSGKKDR